MAMDITLITGAKMPMIGLGSWKSKPSEVRAAVESAIDAGYRHIDCAFSYGNEKEIGEAIQCKIEQGVVKREDLFITSKLWCTYFAPHRVRECCRISLQMLRLEYVDLYLMHFPIGLKFTTPENVYPYDEEGVMMLDEDSDYVTSWKELEKLQDEGLARAIGISNFNQFQIERLLSSCRIQPAVHQIENHPYLDQDKMITFCTSKNIVVTGYSPFGSVDRPWVQPDDPCLFDEEVLHKIAKNHGKTVAQVLLRYQIQSGVAVVPKSVSPTHIFDNIQVFDFSLTESDIGDLKSLDRNWRALLLPMLSHHKHYPFREDYSEQQ